MDVLAERLVACAQQIGAHGLLVSGGVAANSALRQRCNQEAKQLGLPLFVPPPALATDNAVMIAGLGHFLLEAGATAGLEQDALARVD